MSASDDFMRVLARHFQTIKIALEQAPKSKLTTDVLNELVAAYNEWQRKKG